MKNNKFMGKGSLTIEKRLINFLPLKGRGVGGGGFIRERGLNRGFLVQ